MTRKFKIFIKCFCLCLFLIAVPINAQVLQDTASLNLVRKDIGYIYNLKFNKAREVTSKISHLYPGHPVVALLNGMIIYWENYPMLPSSSSRASFEKNMRESISLCENSKNSAYEVERLLTNLCARGMLLMFYTDNDLVTDAIPLTVSSYKYMRHSFEFTSVCSDLNYFTGIYNYYREAYPAAYPVYKPLTLLFPAGDIKVGLKELQNAALNSVVLKAESYYVLDYIYLSFENNYAEALYYSKSLHDLYPDNIQYLAVYIRDLLLTEKYNEAEKLIIDSPADKFNKYFQAQLTIFKGIIQEKKYHNLKLAEDFYRKGGVDISGFGEYGNRYSSYVFFGLSRISAVNGESDSAKVFRKKALKQSEFKSINFDN